MSLGFVRTSALLLVASAIGCGSGETLPTVPVTGTVTYQGKPLEGATVTFSTTAESGRPASGTTDASGKFSLKTYLSPTSSPTGALPGDYTVMITKVETQSTGMTPEDMAKKMASKAAVMAPPKHLIPERYSGAKSGLNATVKAQGPNDFPFDLQDK